MKSIRNNLIVEMHVPDLEVIKEFYARLGSVVALNNEPNETELGYVTMVRDDPAGKAMLNFYGGDDRVYDQSFFKQFPRDTRRGYATNITIPTGDIEGLYKAAADQLKDHIVREITQKSDHEHSWKDFRMVDPFGYYLRFTELLNWKQPQLPFNY